MCACVHMCVRVLEEIASFWQQVRFHVCVNVCLCLCLCEYVHAGPL